MKKITKRILAVVMALTLMLGMTTMVGATGTQEDTGLIPEEGHLTKILVLPEGAAIPAKDFSFTFTPISVDGAAYVPAVDDGAEPPTILTPANMPALSSVASFTAGMTPDGTSAVSGFETKTVSSSIFSGVTWPHAGEYVYEVEETQQPTVGLPGHDSSYHYSQAKYQVIVFVTTPIDGQGNPTGEPLEVDSVGFRAMVDDEGTAILPQPEITDPDDPEYERYPKADPIFKNRYVPPTTFKVSKEVKGTYADTTFKFDYTLEMTRPTGAHSVDTELASYTGIIFNADHSVDTTAAPVVVTFPSGYAAANSVEFQLSDGQYLLFDAPSTTSGDPTYGLTMTGLPTGVTYTLQEDAADNYKAAVDVWINNATATATAQRANTEPGDLKIGDGGAAPLDAPINLGSTLNGNIAAWSNTRLDVTPTGILLNNLPFILLIVVALGGFTLYIASKRRKAAK